MKLSDRIAQNVVLATIHVKERAFGPILARRLKLRTAV